MIQHGEAKHPRLAALLAPLVERRLLPYVRQRYASEDVVVCDAFVRRYRASERLALSNHFDALSYVTAVVGLNPGEFSGGLYVQVRPREERSRPMCLRRYKNCGVCYLSTYGLVRFSDGVQRA